MDTVFFVMLPFTAFAGIWVQATVFADTDYTVGLKKDGTLIMEYGYRQWLGVRVPGG